MGPKSQTPWYKDFKAWLFIAGFCGVTSLGTLIAQGQKVIGYLAAPTVRAADSSGREAVKVMMHELRDTILAANKRDHAAAMTAISEVREVVERMPGAKRAGEQIRREREARRTVWNNLKGETP